MIHLSCHCGLVRIEIARRPEYINACNCSLCSKTGAHWGYFAPADVAVHGETSRYLRGDKADAGAHIHFCPACGSTSHFTLTDDMVALHGNTMLGVNMQLADPAELEGLELRFPDGRNWDGASAFGYVREAVILG